MGMQKASAELLTKGYAAAAAVLMCLLMPCLACLCAAMFLTLLHPAGESVGHAGAPAQGSGTAQRQQPICDCACCIQGAVVAV